MVDSKKDYIVYMAIVVSLLLLVAPFWGQGGITYSGQVPTDTSIPTFNILDPLGFVNDIFNRFIIFLTLTAKNPLLSIVLSALTLGFFWIGLEMLRGN